MATLRRICLVGVRGVGKTTLVRSVLPELEGVEHIVGSAVLRELAGAEFDRFDHLAPARKQAYREEAILWMERHQEATQRHVLCDGHTSLLDESTGRVGVVFTESDCRFFRELVLLEAPLVEVLSRRRADPSKSRSLDPEVVRAEMAGESESCVKIADRWGMRLHRLPTEPDAARVRLLEVLAS
ncbi:MAG: AAA family ATPase [Proteobacteria bacterium]|nr:AAA family ATPase [Pseudomonadota bacterium]